MKSVTVVGCGIVGLTTAIALQEKGWKVKLIAKEKFEETLSHKVGAIWFPFEVHPIEKANHWGALAYERYKKEVLPNNGVSFIPFIVAYNEQSDTSWTKKLPKEAVRKALKEELPSGIEMAYIAQVPLAEPPIYLPTLFQRFLDSGGEYETREIKSLQELSGLNELVINSTGLGAKTLCSDSDLNAMRGQILRCEKMDNVPSCVNSTQKGQLSYVINRSADCIVGGTDYENDWNLNVEPTDTDLIKAKLAASGFDANKVKVIESLVGLRPWRKEVRFEFDENHPNVFHNYGHGGAGFTVAWGCALDLVEQLS